MYHNIVVLSGGFDPIHEGHISMFSEARNRYDKVIVGLNSDEWLTRKKGKPFMYFSARRSVLEAISYIDEVVTFDDSDNSATDLLRLVKERYPASSITFGNGGDRSSGNYPELAFCKANNIITNDSLGGTNKKNSSSVLLDKWATTSATREWGTWKVLYEYPDNTTKVKELIVMPGKGLSWQRHFKRSELWYIRSGTATIISKLPSSNDIQVLTLSAGKT